MPDARPGEKLIRRRHAEWRRNVRRWTFLLDSLEGGEAYRTASYGVDARGWPIRNLVRHPREYPAPGVAVAAAGRISDEEAGTFGLFVDGRIGNGGRMGAAGDEPQGDEFWTRWHRTPPPTFVAEAVDFQVSRIFGQEPRREGPASFEAWAEDVDGSGISYKRWVREELAPRLLVLGCVDVLADRPALPDGEELPETLTVAGRERLGLDRVEVRLIDPQDVLDWAIDRRREYVWVLNREYHPVDDEEGTRFAPRYRRWDREGWTLYDHEGERIGSGTHGLGFVPQRRLFTRRAPRATHTGVSYFEATADLAREYYNRDSELVLSDSLHAHPQLQGDADAIEEGATTIGPGWMLGIRAKHDGKYIPYSVIDFPQGGAESIRENKRALREASDRLNGIAAPAGASGSTAGTVAQSGVSKSFDDRRANDLLSRRADVLADAETHVVRLVVSVAADGNPSDADLDAVAISYTKQFNLLDASEMGERWALMVETLNSGRGVAPEAALLAYMEQLKHNFAGLSDAEYAALEAEARDYLESGPGGGGGGGEADLPDFDPDDPDSYADDPGADDFDDDEEGA